MNYDQTQPKRLYFTGTLLIDGIEPAGELSAFGRLNAIAFADFRSIYIAVSQGYPLSDDQAYAIKRIRRDKSGQLIELSIKNRAAALDLLGKAVGFF